MRKSEATDRQGLLCLALVLSFACTARGQGFGISELTLDTNAALEYEARTDCYYRIQTATSLTGTWSVEEYQLGTQSFQGWVHSGVLATNDRRYYRVGRLWITNSLDYDGDTLGDGYEMSNPHLDFRDPDSDGDLVVDGQEFHLFGTDPSIAFSGSTIYYPFTTNVQEWGAESGAYGTASIAWTSTGFPSGGALSVSPEAGAGYGDYYIRDGSLYDNQNVIARPIHSFWVYLPAGAPSDSVRVQPWVKSTSDGWLAHWGDWFILQAGQWNHITWDMSALSTQVLADVDEWAVKIIWNNRTTWNGAVYVDTIHVRTMAATSAAPPVITAVTPLTNNVGMYRKFEATVGLTNVYGLSPYDPYQVSLEGIYSSPSGVGWTNYGFYMEETGDAYGRGRWKIRFAPNETGKWSYHVRVVTPFGTNATANSTFDCVASGDHGWLRVCNDDPHYLEYDDDSSFYGIGYCRPYYADDEGIFQDAWDHGVNLIHWWMAPYDTMLTVEGVGQDREDSSYTTYEQGRAARIDRVVELAEQYNVKLVFTIWTHDALRDFNYHKFRSNGSWQKAFDTKWKEPEWYINAFSRMDEPAKSQKFFHDSKYFRYQENLYRYIIARWGYSQGVGMWALVSEMFGTMANSLNCVRWQDPQFVTNKSALVGQDPYLNMDTNQVDGLDYSIPWLSWIHGYFKTNDPFRHPTTASGATDEYWDQGDEVVDIPQIHSYAESYGYVTPPITFAKYNHYMRQHFNKPFFIGETGSWRWQTYQPDFLRASMWPALCSGAPITPMMWTVPGFGQFCDPVMGPWLDDMADEAQLFAQFIQGIDFNHVHFSPAVVSARDDNDPSPTTVTNFEGGISTNWQMWGSNIDSMVLSTNWASEGSQSLRMNMDLPPWNVDTNPASGVQNFTLAYDWGNYWPDGALRVDLYMPPFYHPTNNPDGFLTGVNRDPRCIIEVGVEKPGGGGWNWYSTKKEYSAEAGGWKKLTLDMPYHLEFSLDTIPTVGEAQDIRAIKIWFGDYGILRGPVYIDNITVGRYPYNTWGMISSNGEFAIAWVQDRQWTNTSNNRANFSISGLKTGGIYNVEWWNMKGDGINSARNTNAANGTLNLRIPSFRRDVAMKIRRIGNIGTTVHDVSLGSVSQIDWKVRSQSFPINMTIVNQGTANESCDVSLFDVTDNKGIGTNKNVNVNAGQTARALITWSDTNASLAVHTLRARVEPVSGETDTADNELTTRIRVVSQPLPWDPCERMRRWAARKDITDAQTLVVSTNRAVEGNTSFLLTYAIPTTNGADAEMWFDNVFENWSGKTGLSAAVYRDGAAGASNVQMQIWTGTNWTWYYSWDKTLSAGWNSNVTFTLNAAQWGDTNGWGATPQNLWRVQQILFKFTGYGTSGVTYIDNIRLSP